MGLEKINVIRKEKGITIEDLSERSGVALSTLKKICAGITTNPNIETVKAIVRALGCRLDDLDEPMSFADRLKEARISAALSQKDLGDMVGVTGNAISNYEKGTSIPNKKTLLRLFDALGVEPNFLFQDSFAKEKAPAMQELSKEHLILIQRFDQASQQDRELILRFAELAASAANRAPADQSPQARANAALHRMMLQDSVSTGEVQER